MNKNTAFDTLLESLKTDKWDVCITGYTLEHKNKSVSIWMANVPILNTNVYKPAPMSLSLWQKYKLYKAAKIAINNSIVSVLKD